MPVNATHTGEDGEYYSTSRLWVSGGAEHRVGFTFDNRLSENVVTTARLYVPELLQDKGLAARLLKAGFALAKANGVLTSKSHISSPYALMARRSIFGDENITLCDDDIDATPLEVTVDDAIDALENRKREYGYVVISSLVNIDASSWHPEMVSE